MSALLEWCQQFDITNIMSITFGLDSELVLLGLGLVFGALLVKTTIVQIDRAWIGVPRVYLEWPTRYLDVSEKWWGLPEDTANEDCAPAFQRCLEFAAHPLVRPSVVHVPKGVHMVRSTINLRPGTGLEGDG